MTNSEKNFYERGYGRFPYIILKETFGVYRQIPILQLQQIDTNLEGVFLEKLDFDSKEQYESECIQVLIKILNNTPVLIKKSMIKKENRIIIGGTPKKSEGCLVLSEDEGIYGTKELSKDVVLERSNCIPTGGQFINLLDEEMKFKNGQHYIS